MNHPISPLCPTSSEISQEDINTISQITKSLLQVNIPYDVITKIIKECYKTNENEDRYFQFSEGCESGGDHVLMKLSCTGKVELLYRSMWIDNKNKLIICTGRYQNIWGTNGITYGLIIIESIIKRPIKNLKAQEEEIILTPDSENDIFFDFFQFDKWIQTEFGQDLPINLYANGGCYSIEHFNAYMTVNTRFNAVIKDEYKELNIISNGLKLERITENSYTKLFKRKYGL